MSTRAVATELMHHTGLDPPSKGWVLSAGIITLMMLKFAMLVLICVARVLCEDMEMGRIWLCCKELTVNVVLSKVVPCVRSRLSILS